MGRVYPEKKSPYAVVFIKGFSFVDNQKILYLFILKPLDLNNFSSKI